MKMYKATRQKSLSEFMSPFGKLDPENRWVKIANLINWDKYEAEYAKQFCEDNGAPATSFRMALGTLIIKQRTGNSDEETLQDIRETPYMQYLIGLTEYTTEAPFCSSSITNFRKYITQEMVCKINEDMFLPSGPNQERADRVAGEETISEDSDASKGNESKDTVKGENESDKPGEASESDKPDEADSPASPASPDPTLEAAKNQGELILDATCAPSDITYPTDEGLLNEAREKLEDIIDTLHRHTQTSKKPRTYRRQARRRHLRFIKNRKPSKKLIRKTIGQQLRYVRRDLSHIDEQLKEVSEESLTTRQSQILTTIRSLYAQQEEMYRTRTHTIANRIVSITQPWVRPMVRGKAKSAVEFGAKISISMVDGYAFIDKLCWEAYSEASLLIAAVESYKQKHGFYPQAVIADKLYRNRENLSYCKKRGIRLSGPRLGRPPKHPDNQEKHQERKDASVRNAVEGKFGEGKTRYGLDRIMARLQDTSETVISMIFLCMNISRRLRVLCAFLLKLIKWYFIPVDNFSSMA
jgi:hypothetical protein